MAHLDSLERVIHIKEGSITADSTNIMYWFHSSVDNYGYGGAFRNAFNRWDEGSSAIGFSRIYTSDGSGADLKIYLGSTNLPPGTIAAADYWKYNWYGGVSSVSPADVTNGTDYDQGRIRYDHAQSVELGYNNYKVAGHEVGHILGLNHFQNEPAPEGNHWMKSGSFTLTTPTSTDLTHLRVKWGY